MDFSPVQTLTEKLASWLRGAVALLPNLVVAILVVVAFWLIARAVRGIVRNLIGRVSNNRQIAGLLATLSYVAVIAIGVFVALGVLELDSTVNRLLAGVGIIGLALGFAFQDLAANFMAGVIMSFQRPFKLDDIIETNGHMGVVEDLSLRSTFIRTFQNQVVMVPNKDIFGNPLINYSAKGKRRVDLSCGVAYGDDLAKAKEIAVAAIEGLELRDESRDVELFYNEFGGSSINFTLRFWIDFAKQTDFLQAQSEGIIALKKAFDEGGITIPFPIRTLDFGVVGGEPLREALPKEWIESLMEGSKADKANGDKS